MPRGGKRINAGRPAGSSRYGETTKVLRVPLSRVDDVRQLIQNQYQKIPLFSANVPAGFPSPADDYIEDHLDLNEHLIKHPAATFMVRATGDSMIGAGIFSGDILIVDRSLPVANGAVVIAAIDGELTVKRFFKQGNSLRFKAENPDYPDIVVKGEQDTIIWGVVTNVIHAV